MSAENENELEEISNRWKKEVFAFCKTFLGDERSAEVAACEAFVALYRERGMKDRDVLARLLRLALRAIGSRRNESSESLQPKSPLESAIQRLPRLERAVVIMRNLLHLKWESTAMAAELSTAQAQQVWRLGISQLTALLRN